MKVENYYGRKQTCLVCQSEDVEKYFTYTPPFRNALDTVFVCGCKEHVKEAEESYNRSIGAKDRIETAGSNS
jgi:hypothetical protein